jgi:hypothetical protein
VLNQRGDMALEYRFHVTHCTPWDFASRYILENTFCLFCVDFGSQLCYKLILLSEFPRDENLWLNSDAAKHRLEVFTLMPQLHKPINSLDINSNRIVCGCDNEAVYVFNNVKL